MEDVEHLPSWLLTQTAGYAGRMVSARFADVGARGYHYRVLSSLAMKGPASQADLGRRVGIHLSDMVKALNEMAAAGFIRRVPNPDDRRRNIIMITDQGRARTEQLARQAGSIQDELLEPLDRAEREQLTTLLTKLYRYHRMQESAPPPME
ncbi:MarR family winged helix-turn-helix transcriptional regulator [Actinoplanes sp. NPDC051513]|uniref:MarR family winged helix-turn-helix transcriptional regulator n=1 Tax=Actinoplanes sp. NPDC051513 TaxID=3363908 RepID=UPI0037B3F5F2